MKRFKFRFESVEKVRSVREKQALGEVARTQQALFSEENNKKQIEEKIQAALIARENLANGIVGSREYQLATSYLAGLKQDLARADVAVRRAKRGVEKAMTRALLARRDLKMIETLRERDVSEFKKERSHYEQKQYDELSIMRNRMQQGESE